MSEPVTPPRPVVRAGGALKVALDLRRDGARPPREPIRRVSVDLPANSNEAGKGATAFVLYNVLSREECATIIKQSHEIGYEEALVNVGGGIQVRMDDVRNNTRCMVDDTALADELMRRLRDHIPAEWPPKDRRARGTSGGDGEDGRVTGAEEGKVSTGWRKRKEAARAAVPVEDVVEINERFRILRYTPGQEFKAHRDGCYVRDRYAVAGSGRGEVGDVSRVTLHVYLNDGVGERAEYEGGTTRFLDWGKVDDPDSPEHRDVLAEAGMCLVFEHPILHQGSVVTRGIKYTVRTDVMYRRRGGGGKVAAAGCVGGGAGGGVDADDGDADTAAPRAASPASSLERERGDADSDRGITSDEASVDGGTADRGS